MSKKKKDNSKSLKMNDAQLKAFNKLKAVLEELEKLNVGLIGDQYGGLIYGINLENVSRCWSNSETCYEDDGAVWDIDTTYENPEVQMAYVDFKATLDEIDSSFGVQFKQ